MPTDLVWHDRVPDGPRVPGQCYAAESEWGPLSDHYRATVASTRPPIVVILPSRSGGAVPFCVDWSPSDDPHGNWQVGVDWPIAPGSRPNLTVNPSINVGGIYHGWIKAGVITDDIGD